MLLLQWHVHTIPLMGRIIDDILDRYPDHPFLIISGLDDAVVGLDERSMRVVYSIEICINILIKEGMDEDEATDYIFFEWVKKDMGDMTPIWISTKF